MPFTSANGNSVNRPMAVLGKSLELRSQWSDGSTFRDFATLAEALAFLTGSTQQVTDNIRKGHASFYVSASGVTTEYWWPNEGHYLDTDVAIKMSSGTANISDTQSAALMDTKDQDVVATLRANVATAGDNLAKIYALYQALNAIVTDTTPDGNAFTDKIQEVLAIMSTYPEGVSMVTALGGKVDTGAIINALTQTASGGVLDARQGKALKDLIDSLALTVPAAIDYSFASVAYAATISRAYDKLRPNVKIGDLTGDLVLTNTGPAGASNLNGDSGTYQVKQDGTGGRTVTMNGTVIPVNPAAASVTLIGWVYDGSAYSFDTNYTVAASSETGSSIAAKLQALTGTARLDASAIQNLPAGGVVDVPSVLAILSTYGVTITPPAPISITINDNNNTATIVPPTNFAASLLEYSTDNGSTWADTTNGVASVGDVAIASGAFKARVKAGTNRNAGAILTSSQGFTVAPVGVTNILPNSHLFQQTPYNGGSLAVDIGANAPASPDGTLNLSKIRCFNSNASFEMFMPGTIPLIDGQVYTIYADVKAGEITLIKWALAENQMGQATFDLTTGTVSSVTNGSWVSALTASMQDLSGLGAGYAGYWRCKFTFTYTHSGALYFGFVPLNFVNGGDSFYIWRMQLNTGSTALTYVETP